MQHFPNLNSVIPLEDYPPNNEFDWEFDEKLLDEAVNHLDRFAWNEGIEETYIGYVLKEKLGVFLFKIKKTRVDVDEWIWVIVGDLPPAYITTDECKIPSEALDGYIGAMEEWIRAINLGKSIEGLIPVNATPTIENAKSLESRMTFIDKRVLPKIRMLEKSLSVSI